MDEKDVDQLYQCCMDALNRYVKEAEETCKFLRSLKGPVPLQQMNAIIAQRCKENDAHIDYRKASDVLFDRLCGSR
jgi:hypothetical protein